MAIESVSSNNALYERIAIGDTIIQDIATIQVLVARVDSNDYGTFRLQGATSGYQVPASKRFRVIAVHYFNIGGSTQTAVGIGTGTNDVGFNSASEPTSPDYSNPRNLPILTAGTLSNKGFAFCFATGRYPYFYSNEPAACWLFGYEE